MLNQTSKKMALWFLGIIGVGVVVWLGALYLNPEERAKRDALKYFEDLQAQYESDTYGGATPEETLQLFIAALEAGDIELASKYFLPDERGEWRTFLNLAIEEKRVERIRKEIGELKLSRKDTEEAFFTLTDEGGVVDVIVILKKNQNGVWKITDL